MKSEPTIHNFFIYNPLLAEGREETEHEKNIYYYPPTDPINIQTRNIGFVEAIVQFTDSFKPSKQVHALHTKKKQQYYFQPENNFWLVLTVNTPTLVNRAKDGKDSSAEQVEDLPINVYKPFLEQCYQRYKLLHGEFTGNGGDLKRIVNDFFSEYLRGVSLGSVNILNVLGGIKFLPLSKLPFLQVQCFLNALKSKFSCISTTCFYYDDFVVSTGIEVDNMRNLNTFLLENVIRTVKDEEMGSKIFSAAYQGKFIKDLPIINFTSNSVTTKYYLTVYNVLKTSLCILTEDLTPPGLSFTRDLEIFIGPEMVKLNSLIYEKRSKTVPSNLNARIVYFNQLNLAFKNSICPENSKTNEAIDSTVQEAMHLIADIRKKQENCQYYGEIIVKAMNDFWVAGKLSNSRELYILLENKNASLIDISDEIRKICDNELKGIYFN